MHKVMHHVKQACYHQQISALLVGVVVCVLFLACGVSAFVTGQQLHARVVTQAKGVVNSISQQAALPLLYGSRQNAAAVMQPYLLFPDVVQIALWEGGDSGLLYQVGELPWLHQQSDLPINQQPVIVGGAASGANTTAITTAMPGETQARAEGLMMQSPEAVFIEAETADYWQVRGAVLVLAEVDALTALEALQPQTQELGFVRVMVSKAQVQTQLNALYAGHGVLALVLGVIALILGRILGRRMVRSVDQVHEALHELCVGTLSNPLPVSGPQEMRQLRETFNRTVQLIDEREQQLLLACDQAKADGQMKAEFVANVSHQIRTPLNGILGTLNLIEFSHLNDEEKGYLTMARQSGQSLLTLVNSVLDFSALSSGKIKLRLERLNLQNLIESVLALHANTEAGKGLEMVCAYDRKVPIEVVGDMARIHQALNNLIGNAVKFTYSGSVQVRVKVMPPPSSFNQGLLPDQKLFQIAIRDTGVGISASEMKHLFEPYTRRQSCAVQREFGGCGLGLAITKSLVDLMGGEIHVESLEGEGSQFSMLLPMKLSVQEPPKFEIARHFDFIYCVSEPGLHKEALVSVAEQWGIPYAWSFQLYDWERHIPRDVVPQRLLLLINGIAQMQRYEEHLTQMRERFLPMIVRFYQPLAEDRLLTSLIDLHVAKPVRRALLEEEVLRHVRSVDGFERGRFGADADTVEVADTDKQLDQMNILVVEDNKINQQVARATLEKIGCRVTLAENGQIAVDLMQDHCFDLIFMDCQMPVMDGFTATEKIRDIGGVAQQVPIIALSANTSGDDQARCRAVGMNDFIGKPFNQHQLRDALQRWILDRAA